jgi:hypothetical protein
MHIIDENGKIVEGQPLTAEEVSILTELNATISWGSGTYVTSSDRQRFAAFLIGKFLISRRPEAPCPAVDEQEDSNA